MRTGYPQLNLFLFSLLNFEGNLEGGMNHLLRRNRPHRPAAPTGVDQQVPARPLEFPAVHFPTFIYLFRS
jgi:hypothetical protein